MKKLLSCVLIACVCYMAIPSNAYALFWWKNREKKVEAQDTAVKTAEEKVEEISK